ncbi:hypothetical protein DER53_13325 [Parageobacillus toebii NBRC 107807]|uniref:TIGR04104 family putative zinc finger protein n=1 Tax=Parageobacillus toebii TaxID=153151 RepID=UPI00093D4473|nr:hypothetical protein DER53_13325 [Parageobacillus toebii NBRC 107807]
MFGWKRFICPHCKTKLYPTAESRQKASFANSLSLLVLLLLPSFGVSFLWTFIIYFVLLASILALLPFSAHLLIKKSRFGDNDRMNNLSLRNV